MGKMSDVLTEQGREAPPILTSDVPVEMPDLPLRKTISTLPEFKAISDRVRAKILGVIQNQPATAKQIADRLKASPGAIGHHLHVLEEAGLAQVIARRITRGIVASYYTRTAKIFVYEFPPDVAGPIDGYTNILETARNEFIDAIASVSDDPFRTDGFPHARLSQEQAQYYQQRIADLIDEMIAEPADPEGKVYGLFTMMFQSPTYMQKTLAADKSLDHTKEQD